MAGGKDRRNTELWEEAAMAMVQAKSMIKEKVIELLEYYKDIDGEIKFYKKLIADDEDTYYNPLGAITSDGLPKGKNNISRQTENMAMNVPDCVSQSIKENESRVNELHELKAQIIREISRLEYKEKSILFDFYINGLKWEQVAVRNHYSERQCKNIRNMAVESLIPKFQNNQYISKFQKTA